MSRPFSSKLLDAAEHALAERAWDEVTLEHIADQAGLSRVTLWRQGVAKDALLDALLQRLAEAYKLALWPALSARGSGRARLEQALHALCDVADEHLPLLQQHQHLFGTVLVRSLEWQDANEVVQSFDAHTPFVQILRDGFQDGSLRSRFSPSDTASFLFDLVTPSYVQLRRVQKYTREWSRKLLFELVLYGLAAEPHDSKG